jgi:hypothetical protein
MTRRFILSFLSALLILLLAPLVPSAEAQAPLVAVRVPVAGQELWARSGIAGELLFDYGVFTWVLGHPFDSKQGWGRLNLAAVLNLPGEVLYFAQEHVFTESGQTY